MTATNPGASMSASESSMNVPRLGQKRLVIVGATGMVGGYALRYMLDHPAVGHVTSVGRTPLGISHPGGSSSRLRGLLGTRGDPVGSARSALLPGHLHRGGAGRRASHDNRGLHDRVRGGSPPQQPRRDVRIFERERRRPDGSKSDVLRTLQGRGRERTTRGGLLPSLPLPARVHLPGRAAEGTEFRLSPVACDLPRVSGALPQPGDSGRRLSQSHGGCCPAGNR